MGSLGHTHDRHGEGMQTWPREAAAMGRSEMELKIWAMGRPSSFSIISNACRARHAHHLHASLTV